jgi:hypothetical protein
MFSMRYCLYGLVVCLVASAACTSSPAAPSAVSAPIPQSPSNGAVVGAQPVTLVVQNATVTDSSPVTYTFEVSTDSAFANKVQTKVVAAGANGQTSATLGNLASNSDYYWHAQAAAGGTTGVFSTTSKFTIGAALNAPVAIAPASGSTTAAQPTLVVANATRTGPVGVVVYRFEISTSNNFATIAASGTVPEGQGTTQFTPAAPLAANTVFFWRVTPIDQTTGAAGPAMPTLTFTTTQQSVAAGIAAQMGQVLWPGTQPPNNPLGQAVLGDNWQIQTLFHVPTQTYFQSPSLENLRFFDLFDRGLDPQSAINWLNANGYPTSAQWYPPPDKAVLGFEFVYIAARDKIVVHGTWDIVLKLE